jgi:hypothetical protein
MMANQAETCSVRYNKEKKKSDSTEVAHRRQKWNKSNIYTAQQDGAI